MKLYYTPGACSLADHIALVEAGLPYDLERVDLQTKRTESGADFAGINPKGYVPALALDDGAILTENIAILAFLADRAGTLGGGAGMDRFRVIEATAFISSELHKNFKPFFMPDASDGDKAKASETLSARFGLLATQLGARAFLVGDAMTVADCYLFVMLMWARKNGVTMPDPLPAYFERLGARPAVQQALREEGLA